jgi:hypothetical protein
VDADKGNWKKQIGNEGSRSGRRNRIVPPQMLITRVLKGIAGARNENTGCELLWVQLPEKKNNICGDKSVIALLKSPKGLKMCRGWKQ